MQKEFLDQYTNFTKNSVKPLMAWQNVFSTAFQNLSRQGVEILNDVITTNISYLQTISNAKNIEGVIHVQTQTIKESGSKAINYAQKSLEAFVSVSTEFSKMMEESFSGMPGVVTPGNKSNVASTSKA